MRVVKKKTLIASVITHHRTLEVHTYMDRGLILNFDEQRTELPYFLALQNRFMIQLYSRYDKEGTRENN